MLFWLLTTTALILLAFLFWKRRVPYPFSRLILLMLIFSVLATGAFGQNYGQSMIPGIYDGIGISNKLAYFIIGEDGWSQELFGAYYEGFMTASLVLMGLYIVALLLEANQYRK